MSAGWTSGPICTLVRAIDGFIMPCGTITPRTHASELPDATSEIVRRF